MSAAVLPRVRAEPVAQANLHPSYRPDIDGLRAISVIGVLLYHLGLPAPRAGLLGVDVFYVISGFLITNIIASELSAGRFSFRRFYERRARRILPALLVMIVISMPFAFMWMLPNDLENYGQSVVATVMFANNVLLYMTAGYFDLDAAFKPLAHTWSLGVEEQYYLLAPLVLGAAFASGGRRQSLLLPVVLLVSVASFGCCLWLSATNANANFYLLPSRAWEIAVGAAVALWGLARPSDEAHAQIRRGLCNLGLAMVVFALFALQAKPQLPSWPTLLPVLGAALVLGADARESFAAKILTLRPLVFIGLISYSLYLYHQPVIVFARIAALQEPTLGLKLALLPLIVALAALSWRYVETPARSRQSVAMAPFLWGVLGLSGALGACGLLLHLTSGLYALRPELYVADPGFGRHQNIAFNERPYQFRDAPFTAAKRPRVLVVGNSFARDFINMGLETRALTPTQVSYSEIAYCHPPLPAQFAKRAREADLVVLGSGVGSSDVACIKQWIRDLAAIGQTRVVVLGTKNFGWNNDAVMLLPAAERYRYRAPPLRSIVADNRAAAAAFPPDVYVDILALLDQGDGRVPVFTPDRKLISQDRRHLTQAGARYVGAIVFQHPALRWLKPSAGESAAQGASRATLTAARD